MGLIRCVIALVVSFWIGFCGIDEFFLHFLHLGLRAQEHEIAVLARSVHLVDVLFSELLLQALHLVDVAVLVGPSHEVHDGGRVHAFHPLDHVVLEGRGEPGIEPIGRLIDITVVMLRRVRVTHYHHGLGKPLEAPSDEPRQGVLGKALVHAQSVKFIEDVLVFPLEGVLDERQGHWSAEGAYPLHLSASV